jgi:hypothetical protein
VPFGKDAAAGGALLAHGGIAEWALQLWQELEQFVSDPDAPASLVFAGRHLRVPCF